VYSVLTEHAEEKRFEQTMELDFSFGIQSHRVALSVQRFQPAWCGRRGLPADSER